MTKFIFSLDKCNHLAYICPHDIGQNMIYVRSRKSKNIFSKRYEIIEPLTSN